MAIRHLKSVFVSFALIGCCTIGCKPPADDGTDSPSDATAAAETDADEQIQVAVLDEEAAVADEAEASSDEAGADEAVASDEVVDEDEADADQGSDEEEQAEATKSLTLGDPAPPLAIGKWAKGDAVEGFEAGRVYVVEFWATWCGPCKVGMPHLAELQEKHHDDVTIIGISDESEAKVTGFFGKVQDQESGKTWDEVLTYTIALDDNGKTNKAYMRAAGQNGIPCAFIVGKDGIVEWIGHPASMDDTLAAVVDGTYDRAKAVEEFAERQALQMLMRDINPLLRDARASGDFSSVHKMLDEAVTNGMSKNAVETLRINVANFAQDHEMVNDLIGKVHKEFWDDAQQLNDFAWKLATRPAGSQNLELAMELGMRANELNENDASTLDTIARVFHEMGNLESAVAWQEKAVAANSHPSLARTLENYKSELNGDSEDDESDEETASDDDSEEGSEEEEGDNE